MLPLFPLQGLPVPGGLPGLLSALIIIGIVLVVGRMLLSVAFRIVVVAAVIIGLLWLFGALSLLEGVLPFV